MLRSLSFITLLVIQKSIWSPAMRNYQVQTVEELKMDLSGLFHSADEKVILWGSVTCQRPHTQRRASSGTRVTSAGLAGVPCGVTGARGSNLNEHVFFP